MINQKDTNKHRGIQERVIEIKAWSRLQVSQKKILKVFKKVSLSAQALSTTFKHCLQHSSGPQSTQVLVGDIRIFTILLFLTFILFLVQKFEIQYTRYFYPINIMPKMFFYLFMKIVERPYQPSPHPKTLKKSIFTLFRLRRRFASLQALKQNPL